MKARQPLQDVWADRKGAITPRSEARKHLQEGGPGVWTVSTDTDGEGRVSERQGLEGKLHGGQSGERPEHSRHAVCPDEA